MYSGNPQDLESPFLAKANRDLVGKRNHRRRSCYARNLPQYSVQVINRQEIVAVISALVFNYDHVHADALNLFQNVLFPCHGDRDHQNKRSSSNDHA